MRKDTILSLLERNKKRLMGMGAAALVFLVSSSFFIPFFSVQTYGKEVQTQQWETRQQILLADPPLKSVGKETEEMISSSHSQELLQQEEAVRTDGFSKDDWNLILVNKQHPVPEDYTFELGNITADMLCDARILPQLFAMLQAAREDGVNLIICSSYRDISHQKVLFERKVALYMGQGDNYLKAYKKASQIVTVPGASEHQIGLALDIICDTYTNLDEGFGESKAGKWLQEHSREYGFILRYPMGKEEITGIEYEPWHFRYVGKEAAAIIMDNGITLEEFVESISE